MDPWVEIFENAGWSFSFGRTKTKTRNFSNTMVSFIIFVLMDKKNDLDNLRVDAYCF